MITPTLAPPGDDELASWLGELLHDTETDELETGGPS